MQHIRPLHASEIKLQGYGFRPIIQFPGFQSRYRSDIPIFTNLLILAHSVQYLLLRSVYLGSYSLLTYPSLSQRTDGNLQQPSLQFISEYVCASQMSKCAHNLRTEVLCFLSNLLSSMPQLSFKNCAYLSAWRSDAAPVSSQFTSVFTG